MAFGRSVVILAGVWACGDALAQNTPPPAGFSLSATLGPGWSSNPLDVPGRTKGDASFGIDLSLRHRWNLWDGAGFTLGVSGFSEAFFRDAGGGTNRIAGTASFSQSWEGFSFLLNASARTSSDQWLVRHDSAYQEVGTSVSRTWTLQPNLSLTPSVGIARRFYQDGSEDQLRALRARVGPQMGEMDLQDRQQLWLDA